MTGQNAGHDGAEEAKGGKMDYVRAYLEPIMSSRFEQNKFNRDLGRLRSRLGKRRDAMLKHPVVVLGCNSTGDEHEQKNQQH